MFFVLTDSIRVLDKETIFLLQFPGEPKDRNGNTLGNIVDEDQYFNGLVKSILRKGAYRWSHSDQILRTFLEKTNADLLSCKGVVISKTWGRNITDEEQRISQPKAEVFEGELD